MKSIYQSLSELETSHQPAALCTVVKTSGSTPRHSTSKMLVYPDGSIQGTVGATLALGLLFAAYRAPGAGMDELRLVILVAGLANYAISGVLVLIERRVVHWAGKA